MNWLTSLESVSGVQTVAMFNVQRFTTDDEDIGKADQKSKDTRQKQILNDLLQRARSRANKRPRVVTAEVAPTSLQDQPTNEHSCTTSVPPNALKGLSVDVGITNVPKVVFTKADDSPKDGGGSPRPKKSRRRLPNRHDPDAPRKIGAAIVKHSNETTEQSERIEEGKNEGTAGGAAGEVVKSVVVGQGQGNRPVEEVAEEWGLDKRLTETLHEEGVKHFFPIQVKVVPDIVATERHSHVLSRDICVSAPTGSGKTLVFVLGVLQALIRRRVIRLRALVLLPSRDLAVQVHNVFKAYARGTGLRVGLAIGQTNFLEEQLALVGAAALAGNPEATARATCLQGLGDYSGPDLIDDVRFGQLNGGAAVHVPTGGSSEVDIVVATPGRLLDHLEQTPGFTLQHLRYLVIDEADRLLHQSYHGWVRKVLQAAYRREPGIAAPLCNGVTRDSEGLDITGVEPLGRVSVDGVLLEPVTVRGRPLATGDRVRGPTVSTPPLRKLLFSATLTSSPQKLAELGVMNPIVYTAREVTAPPGTSAADRSKLLRRRGRDDNQEACLDKGDGEGEGGGERRLLSQETKRSTLDEAGVDDYDGNGIEGGEGLFSTPATLEETYMVCEAQTKPLVLISLLRDTIRRHEGLSVVFTSSVDSTHRLFRLLQLFGGFDSSGVTEGANNSRVPDVDAEDEDSEFDVGSVAEFSSSLGQHQRSHIVQRARAGAIRVIVCSDGMARGMDLEGVGLVVNYDVPSHAKTYLHRVGRTARAGERGKAVTITKRGQMKRFRRMRAGVDGKRVRPDPSSPSESSLEALAPRYQRCLLNLKEVLEAERTGELDPTAPVTAVDAE